MGIIGFNLGPAGLIPSPEGGMHLFLTACLKEVWKVMRWVPAARMVKANEWVERTCRDSPAGALMRRTARGGGFIGPVKAVCLLGPLLVGFLLNRHVRAPVAGARGYGPPGLQTTTGLAYSDPVGLGASRCLLKTARRLAPDRDRALSAIPPPDGFALTLVSRVPGFCAGLPLPAALVLFLLIGMMEPFIS